MGEPPHQVEGSQKQRVADQTEEVGVVVEVNEPSEPDPGAFRQTPDEIEILEGHDETVHRAVPEEDESGQAGQEHQVQVVVTPDVEQKFGQARPFGQGGSLRHLRLGADGTAALPRGV